MEYKKIRKDNYTLHVINTDRFKITDIVVMFTTKYNKEDIKYYSMLSKNLMSSCKKYNSKTKLKNKCEYYYSMSIASNYEIVGDLIRFNIYSSFVNPKYVDDFEYKDAIDLIFEVINNPNVKDNKFNSEYFDVAKREIVTSINSKKDNANYYANTRFNEIMFKGCSRGNDLLPSIEELNSVNESNLYSFYKKLFSSLYKLDLFYYGDIDESYINYIENKIVSYKCSNNRFNVIPVIKRNNKVIKIIDSLKFNQSKLYIGYDLSLLSDYELRYTLRVFNTILGTMNDSLLFNIVREENSLCYTVNSYYSVYFKALIIYAGINKDNYDKSLDLIYKCIDKMGDINIVNSMIDSAKMTIDTFLNNYYDDSYSQIENKYISEFDKVDDIEALREKLHNISSEEVVKLKDKLRLNTIYMLKGDE